MASAIFVHKYKYSHDKIRKKFRRLFKDGKVTREVVFKGWVYTPITKDGE